MSKKEMMAVSTECINDICKINYNELCISDYNKEYIFRLLPNINYYFRIYIQCIQKLSCINSEKIIVDFGGGHGFLSLFLKKLGYKIVYCDINPLSVQTISVIKEILGYGPDYIVQGSVNELNQFCSENNLQVEYLIATDLIEHIYDLSVFFNDLKQINPDFEMIFTTGSNPCNIYKCRQLRKIMLQEDMEFLQQRKNFITANFNELTENETVALSKLTRGKQFSDILEITNEYIKTQKYPLPPNDAYNTCNPENGNWVERILPLETYRNLANLMGFDIEIAKGFYNKKRANKFLSIIFATLNFVIKKTGKTGFFFSPFVLFHIFRKK